MPADTVSQIPHRTISPAARVADCRSNMTRFAAAWRITAARCDPKARTEAEAQVFNQMVVALADWFIPHGTSLPNPRPSPRPADDKQVANPMAEVRLLALGITRHNGWFPSDPGFGWYPETSVTGYAPGDRIALTEAIFSCLADAYLTQLTAVMLEPA